MILLVREHLPVEYEKAQTEGRLRYIHHDE